jgi:hypothetical protein
LQKKFHQHKGLLTGLHGLVEVCFSYESMEVFFLSGS